MGVFYGTAYLYLFLLGFYIRDRVSGSKLLQMMAGMSPITYWTLSFIFDLLILLISITLMVITLTVNHGSIAIALELGFLLITFAWAALPFIYTCSFMFTNVSSAADKLMLFLGILSKKFEIKSFTVHNTFLSIFQFL